MTDHPRFRPAKESFETTYREHHGGNLVALVLRLAGPRGRRSPDAPSNPMRALDRALLDGQSASNPQPVAHRSAVRAAVAGIGAILLLSAIVQVLGVRSSTIPPADGRVATSNPAGGR